ncbi:MAG TPA: hypothetical protein VK644_07190 [Chitinophagaceae bacterium]|nr:hypothetical protein [Chitinophagaceae bacterium]
MRAYIRRGGREFDPPLRNNEEAIRSISGWLLIFLNSCSFNWQELITSSFPAT